MTTIMTWDLEEEDRLFVSLFSLFGVRVSVLFQVSWYEFTDRGQKDSDHSEQTKLSVYVQ